MTRNTAQTVAGYQADAARAALNVDACPKGYDPERRARVEAFVARCTAKGFGRYDALRFAADRIAATGTLPRLDHEIS